MGKIITIANQKGGVGKTTSTLNIAAGLVTAGKRVLVVDLDPQANLTTAMGFEPAEIDDTVSDLISAIIRREPVGKDDIIDHILSSQNIFLLPSNIALSIADIEIVMATAREYILRKLLTMIKDEFDFILIDCLPSLGMLTINALTASDEVLIPIKAQYLDAKGFMLLKDTISLIQAETNAQLNIAGIFFTMNNDNLKLARQVFSEISQECRELGIRLFNTKISTSTHAATASAKGKDIFSYKPESKPAKEYSDLVNEILNVERGL